MQFSTPIIWSCFLSVSLLIHCTIARPQGQEDTSTSFDTENLLGETSGTQLIASGDTSSDSNPGGQQTWVEISKPVPITGANCNGATLDQTIHSRRSRRSSTQPKNEDICGLQRTTQQREEGAEARSTELLQILPPAQKESDAFPKWN